MPKGADNDVATENEDTDFDGCGNGQAQPRRLKQRGPNTWGIRLRQLELYRSRHGHCNVERTRLSRRKRKRKREEGCQSHPSGSEDEVEEGEAVLACWVCYQRGQYQRLQKGEKSSLTQEKVDILNELGFMWTKEELDADNFRTKFEELKRYKALHGHCNGTDSVPSLRRWVRNQRDHFRKFQDGKESPINQERIDALNELGFEWDRGNSGWGKWMYRLDELREFNSEHGHCTVSSRTNPTLARWLKRQRVQYRMLEQGKPSTMTNERVHALNEVEGWLGRNKRALPVSSSSHTQAVTSSDAPRDFSSKRGNTSAAAASPTPSLSKFSSVPPTVAAADAASSKTRMVTTAAKRRHLSLADDESDRTDDDSDANDAASSSEPTFTDMLYQLILYKIEHGHSNPPPPKKGTNDRLFCWTQRQRKLYYDRKRNRTNVPHHCAPDPFTCAANGLNTELSHHQVAALEHIGFQWDVFEDRWMRRYKELCEFQRIQGHCNVPTSKSGLGRWVQRQRATFHNHKTSRKHSMADERKEKLDAIGFTWKLGPDRVGWDARFEELRQFREEHGHCLVPKHYVVNKELGKWVSKMRYESNLKARGTGGSLLTKERIEKLIELGFFLDDVENPGHGAKQKTNPMRLGSRCGHEPEDPMPLEPDADPDPEEPDADPEVPGGELKRDDPKCEELDPESIEVEAEPELAPAPKLEEPEPEPECEQVEAMPAPAPAPAPTIMSHTNMGDNQVSTLEHIGFTRYDIDDKWERRYKALCEFQLLHGHCNVPTAKSDLGRWVQLQRCSLKLHKTNPKYCWTDERKARLDAIGFRWKIKPDRVGWDGRYEELKQYRQEHGHCVVPQHYALNKQLGKWVSKMRYESNLKARGTGGTLLTEERIAKLNDIGFWDKQQSHCAKGNDTKLYNL